MEFLAGSLLELITQTSTNLPPDVRAAMSLAAGAETPGTQSSQALDIILSNVDMAVDDEGPICQDTGMPTFVVHTPVGVNQIRIRGAIYEAVAEATRRGKLRPNSVDSLTGANSGNNLGTETPVIHFEQWEEDEIEVKLILKGGGCENKNIQYSVPCELDHLGRADRNLVEKACGISAFCTPMWRGAGTGLRAGCAGRVHRERSRARVRSGQGATVPHAGRRESEPHAGGAGSRDYGRGQPAGRRGDGIWREGFADRVQDHGRQPAAGELFRFGARYDCWAFPAGWACWLDAASGAITPGVAVSRSGARSLWTCRMARGEGFPLTGREVVLTPPLTEAQMRALRVGDVVLIDGEMFTGRDNVHAYLMKNPPPVDLHGAVLYHCGPVMLQEGGKWMVKAAGPTTSIREEPYQADVIRRYGVRVVIGKGGMGPKTLAALRECGAVYLNGIGGAAQYYARTVEQVLGVHLMEFRNARKRCGI